MGKGKVLQSHMILKLFVFAFFAMILTGFNFIEVKAGVAASKDYFYVSSDYVTVHYRGSSGMIPNSSQFAYFTNTKFSDTVYVKYVGAVRKTDEPNTEYDLVIYPRAFTQRAEVSINTKSHPGKSRPAIAVNHGLNAAGWAAGYYKIVITTTHPKDNGIGTPVGGQLQLCLQDIDGWLYPAYPEGAKNSSGKNISGKIMFDGPAVREFYCFENGAPIKLTRNEYDTESEWWSTSLEGGHSQTYLDNNPDKVAKHTIGGYWDWDEDGGKRHQNILHGTTRTDSTDDADYERDDEDDSVDVPKVQTTMSAAIRLNVSKGGYTLIYGVWNNPKFYNEKNSAGKPIKKGDDGVTRRPLSRVSGLYTNVKGNTIHDVVCEYRVHTITGTKFYERSEPAQFGSTPRGNDFRELSSADLNRGNGYHYHHDTFLGGRTSPVKFVDPDDNKVYRIYEPYVVCEDYDLDGTKLGTPAKKWYALGSTARGSDWGTPTTVGAVYTGRKYVSCTSATVNNNTVKVRRYFGRNFNNNLVYNANKPSNASASVTGMPNPATKTENVTYPNTQSKFTVSAFPSLEGFDCTGWYTSPSGGTKYSPGNYYYVNNNNATAGKTDNLYAQWKGKTYTNYLYYNANIGPNGILTKKVPDAQSQEVTYPNTSCKFDVSTDYPERKGYIFDGWYTSPSGGTKVSGKYTVGATYKTCNQSATLYAHWKLKPYWVIYDKNAPNAILSGEPRVQMSVPEVDVGTTNHSASRLGWSFIGWHTNKDAEAPLQRLINSDNDYKDTITLYAIYKRGLTLIFAEDKVTDTPTEASAKSFSRIIMNHVNDFNFASSDVTSASTRTKGTYTATFKRNGDSHIVDMGGVMAEDGRMISTGVQPDETIHATRYFVGWSEQEQESAEGISKFEMASDYTGTIIGYSGTTVNVNCNDTASYQDYLTSGDASTVTIHNENNTVTVYPQYTRTYIKLPDATRNEDKKDENGTDEDKFIGWFTKPQPEDGGTGDGGEYYGAPEDIVRIDGDVVLYPWFNVAPTIVRSKISDGFYEGQPISYEQLMSLVDARDTDNPEPVGPTGLITYDGAETWIDMYNLNAEIFMKDEMGLSDEEIEAVMAQVNTSDFEPELVKAVFYCDGVDSHGNPYSDSVQRYQTADDIKNGGIRGLDTRRTTVGKLDLVYQITDNGTYDGITKILIANGYHVDSPITVQFVLETEIKFNYNPTLDLHSVSIYNTDEALNNTNIARFILNQQKTNDKCDDITNLPWWAAEEDEYAVNDKTKADLYGTLKIVDVYDIRFSSRYEGEHQAACDAAKNIHKLSDLWNLKDTDPETFQHIISYKVEFDCMDQWGKTASGLIYSDSEVWDKEHPELDTPPGITPPDDPDGPKKYGQTKEERSIIITPFNNYDDLDLLFANSVVSEKVRYINQLWAESTLGRNEYWGTNGASELASVFQKYMNHQGIDSEPIGGKISQDNGNSVNIKIYDYSE